MSPKNLVLLTIGFSLFITSCYKEDKDVKLPDNSEPKSMEELNVPQNFDWKTTKTIDVQVTLPYSRDPSPLIITNRQVTKRFFKGYPEDNSRTVNTKITIPAYLSELRLFYNRTKGPNMATIEGENVNYDFNNTQKSAKIVNNDECDLEGFVTYSKGGWGSPAHGNNPGSIRDQYFNQVYPNDFVIGDPNNYTITFEDASDVENYLPGGGKSEVLSKSYTNPNKKLGNFADQVIAARLNVDYDAEGVLGDNENFKLGELVYKDGPFQNMSVNDFLDMAETALGGGGLGDYTVDEYKNAAENIINSFHEGNNANILTCPDEEEENHPFIELTSHCAEPDGIFTITNTHDAEMDEAEEYRVYRNDNLVETGNYELGYNESKNITITFNSPDDVIRVEAEIPDDADNEEEMIYTELTDCGDVEGDDETTEQLQGTLAYEDLWPGKGDYDFNDLVIDYDFEVTKNSEEIVQDITVTFEIKAFGASLHNGFGFTLPSVQPGDIASVSGYDIAESSVFDMDANGTESGQSEATFIVFDDVRRVMPQTTPGIGVNTQLEYDFIDPVSMTMQIEFANNITYSELDIGSFNPFIIVSTVDDGNPNIRGKEVHLTDEEPTDLFDESYFGKYQDDSNPSEGRYFVTKNNLPWGINIAEEFEWVIEKQDITGAYNHFAEWAESGGVNYPDWYQDNTGYRNDNLIYPTQKDIP
ncbi:MAG: LruC domain-containing protein [Bacteroidales bacterium]|nr:LruC domain-containing protein [Bacteroidales bacterium]MCF8332576.1 LruC domain-containing protein [Bacteroidales bacterium]